MLTCKKCGSGMHCVSSNYSFANWQCSNWLNCGHTQVTAMQSIVTNSSSFQINVLPQLPAVEAAKAEPKLGEFRRVLEE